MIRFKSTHVIYADNYAGIGGMSYVSFLELVDNVRKGCLLRGRAVPGASAYLAVRSTKRLLR